MTDRGSSQRRAIPWRGPLALAVLASVCWLTLAVTSGTAAGPTHEFILIEGPAAGTPLEADKFDHVRPNDSKINAASHARGSVALSGPGCDSLHFEGRIGDDHTSEKSCWRVVKRERASRLLIDLAAAIDHENRAVVAGSHHQTRHAANLVESGVTSLDDAFDELEARRGEIKQRVFAELKEKFVEARRRDERAISLFRDDRLGQFQVEDALKVKYAIARQLPRSLLLVRPPKLKRIEGDFESANSQTVYTERATDPDGRDLRYHWTLVEHNDFTCVNFEPNKPRENQAIWHHGDNQGCNHNLEGPRGHVGTVIVVVRDGKFECLAAYEGSQGDGGSPSGVGSEPQPCEPLD